MELLVVHFYAFLIGLSPFLANVPSEPFFSNYINSVLSSARETMFITHINQYTIL
jgi:hypothetical protein